MKRKLACLFSVFCMLASLLPVTALAAEGDGTEAHPYLISDLAALEDFRDSVNSGSTGAGEYFKLTADIDMSAKYSETTGVSWEMIGNGVDYESEIAFQGTFDGGGHTISGLYINKTGSGDEYGFDFGALFGSVDGGTIKNLNVQGYVSVAALSGNAAGIVIDVRNGAITNCSFDGVIECPHYVASGIAIGCSGFVSGCKASGKIAGEHMVAGIVSTDASGSCTITNCINESEITGTWVAGGIAGYCEGRISGCVNRGSVTGKPTTWWLGDEKQVLPSSSIGGIAGWTRNIGNVENCCNTGAVSGNTDVGGILGKADNYDQYEGSVTNVKNCLNAGSVTSTFETDGSHNIGSIAGTIVSEIWDNEEQVIVPGTTVVKVSNCYYLLGTAEKGIAVCGESTDTTTGKTANELASGQVAYLLQEGNGGSASATVWGQDLSVDGLPVVTDDPEKAVYKVTFVTDGTEYAVTYANPGGLSALPAVPSKSGYVFGGWYKEADCANAWDFDTDTFTADRTLYAKWTEASAGGHDPEPQPGPVTPVKPSPAPVTSPFIDVPKGAYYEEAVSWAVENGITSGTDKTHFSPNASCTRAQAVTFLWRAAGEPEPQNTALAFTDVPAGSYYEKAVKWAVENGITAGTSETKFSPNAICTRAQIVTFLYRAENSPEITGNSGFTDVPSGSYYEKAVKWAVENGITSGTGGGKFSPQNSCTRGQLISFLYRREK